MARRSPFPDLKLSLVTVGLLILAMALVLLFLPGGSSTPSVEEVARLAAQPSDAPAPDAGREAALGWRPTGSRTDRIGDRLAVTVRYAKGRARATVTVVDGGPLTGPEPAGAVVRTALDGTRLAIGAGVSTRELGDLAAAAGGEVGP